MNARRTITRWLGRIALVGGVLIGLLLVVVLALPLLVQVEGLREPALRSLSEATHATVRFAGLELTIFPETALTLESVELEGNPTVRVAQCRLGVALWPLLREQRVVLRDVELWDADVRIQLPLPDGEGSSTLPPVQRVRVHGRLHVERADGPPITLEDVNLDLRDVGPHGIAHTQLAGRWSPGAWFPSEEIQFNASVEQAVDGTRQWHINAHTGGTEPITLDGQGSLDAAATALDIRRAELVPRQGTLVVTGPVRLEEPAHMDLKLQGRLHWPTLRPLLHAFGVPFPDALELDGETPFTGTLQGTRERSTARLDVDGAPTRLGWDGMLSKPAAAPLTVVATWANQPLPPPAPSVEVTGKIAGARVKHRALRAPAEAITTDFEWKKHSLALKALAFSLGESHLDGDARVTLAPRGPTDVRLTLHADTLDVDTLTSKDNQSRSTTPTPLRLKAAVRVDTLHVAGTHLSNVRADIALDKGVLTVRPISANVWSGSASGHTTLKLGAQPSAHTSRIDLQDADAEAICRQLTGWKDALRGVLRVGLDVSGTVAEPLLSTNQGQGEFVLDRVRWAGASAFSQLLPAITAASGLQLAGVDLTNITRVRGPLRIRDGRIESDALVLERDNGATVLNGSITQDGRLDFLGRVLVDAASTRNLPRQWDVLRGQHGSVVIPFIMKGTLARPILAVDAAHLAAQMAEKQLGVDGRLLDAGKKVLRGLIPVPR